MSWNIRTIKYEDFLKEPKRAYLIAFNDNEDVKLDYREGDQKNRIIIEKYPWYFCITYRDALFHSKLIDQLLKKRLILRTEKEGAFMKLYCRSINRKCLDEKHQVLIDLAENRIATYEADLTSAQRCLVDHQLKIADNYKILYFDIETDDRGRGIEIGRDRIVSIACVNEQGKKFYYSYANERDILKKFVRLLQDYDLITGWNSEGFDVPYIRERMHRHHIWYNWKEILQVDMMKKMMEIHKRNTELIKEVRGFSLKAISTYFLGETKEEHTMGIYEMFENRPDLLKSYNIQDTVLLKKLDDKLKIIKQKVVEHSLTGCFLDEYAVSRILDMYILRNAKRFGVSRFKTKPAREENTFDPNRKAGYEGGLVLTPVTGIHHKVYHFDFTSLYPTIIQTFNISPDSWIKTTEDTSGNFIYSPNNQAFSTKVGIIPKIITELLDARNKIRYGALKEHKEGTLEYENLYFQQYAFKTISNSFYGILGAPFTRYYKKEVAEAITKSGHYLIKLVKSYCESENITVIYGDTDSVFVKADYEINPDEFHQKINEFISYHLFKHFNVRNSQIDLKVEAVYDSLLMIGKKKYIKNDGGKLKIVGLEARRRETLPYSAKAQTTLVEMLMLQKKTKAEIIKWLLELKEHVIHGKMLKDELILQVKLSKHVDEYVKKIKNKSGDVIDTKPSKLPHVKVALWMKEKSIKENGMNTWEKGCYVKFITLKGYKGVEATSIYNYNEGSYDAVYYWNVKIYAILQRVLESVFPEHNWEQYLIEVKKTRKKNVNKN